MWPARTLKLQASSLDDSLTSSPGPPPHLSPVSLRLSGNAGNERVTAPSPVQRAKPVWRGGTENRARFKVSSLFLRFSLLPPPPPLQSRVTWATSSSDLEHDPSLSRGLTRSPTPSAFLWIEDPEQLPSRQLKAKVDRLEELLRTLGSSSQPSSSLSLPSPPPTAIPPTSRPSPTPSLVVPPIRASHSRASSAPAAVDASVVVPRPVNRARQLAQRILTRLVFAGEDVPQISIPNFDPTFLAAQLSRIEEQYAATVPFFAHPTPSALHAVISAEEYDRCVRAVLPTTQQAQLTLNAFFVLVNPFLGLIHPPTFLAQCEEFWHSGSMPEGAWLATYFLACGNGLSAMSDEIGNGVVPVGEAKEFLVRTWNDAGRRVLAANNFVPKPTIEGIRALHLLLQWWCVDGGRYFEASLSITATIAGAVAELGLNRDPEEDDSNMDPAEHQTRRRIYWATYCHDAMIRGAVGHPWSPYSEEEITVRFPVDDAAASDIPTPLYSAAILNARITKLTTRIKPLTKEEVSSVLDELEALDEPYAKDVLRFAMVRWGYVRLQRFAAKAGVTDGGRQDELSAIYFGALTSPCFSSPSLSDCSLTRRGASQLDGRNGFGTRRSIERHPPQNALSRRFCCCRPCGYVYILSFSSRRYLNLLLLQVLRSPSPSTTRPR